jgi:hypothetical protein
VFDVEVRSQIVCWGVIGDVRLLLSLSGILTKK